MEHGNAHFRLLGPVGIARVTLGLLLAVAVAAAFTPVPASTSGAVAAAGRGPAYRPALQAPGTVTLVFSGDISPPTNEFKGDDHATAQLVLAIGPDLICTAGDNQYETGSGAMFGSPVGFHGSWGKFHALIRCPAEGNHDAADGGAGSPGFQRYFASTLADLPCRQLSPPCRPDLGFYDLDLPNGWYVLVLNSNCGLPPDPATPSCAAGSEQLAWLNFAQQRRHDRQRCSIAFWHHERWGTSFFADDDRTQQFWLSLNQFHADIVGSGHSHSTARMGPMTPSGSLAPLGAGIRQITAGAGGRSLTPHRVNPPRTGTRYRDNTKYGVNRLTLTTAMNPAGWLGGGWTSEFDYVDGTVVDQASAGCWP
jgi:hypothetical protein